MHIRTLEIIICCLLNILTFQYADSYKELNPQCEVPTLVIDGHSLTQSVSLLVNSMELINDFSFIYLDGNNWIPWWNPRSSPPSSNEWSNQATEVSRSVNVCTVNPRAASQWVMRYQMPTYYGCSSYFHYAGSSSIWCDSMWNTTYPGTMYNV